VPVLLLQWYILIANYILLSIRAPPVSHAILYFSGDKRDVLCANLNTTNCAITYERGAQNRWLLYIYMHALYKDRKIDR